MSQKLTPTPWGAQDRYQAHFIVKAVNKNENADLLAKTILKTSGHFAQKTVTDVKWVGGSLADQLNSDIELKNMILKLPYSEAHVWIEPTKNGIRIHGKWKSSYEFGISKELFAVYDKIAFHIKNKLGSPPI